MSKDYIKQGFDAAEKEHQEKEIKKIKEIVQKHLEKISFHHEQAKDHQEKERLLKKDLDDLKAGRLDKIEERQQKDEKAKEIRIIEIHRVEKEYIPMYPWRSPYIVQWAYPLVTTISNGANAQYNILTSQTLTGTSTVTSSVSPLTGVQCANFTSGSYTVNGNTINL